MARITYTNKTTAATSPLPATQKLTSGDANEIKASVNAAYDQIEEVAGEVAAIAPKYKVLRILLNQSGTDDPTMVVLENTTGEAPVATRTDTGNYKVEHSMIVPGKTFLMPGSIDMVNNLTAITYGAGTGEIIVSTADIASFPSSITSMDNILYNASMEILIYP